MILRHKESLWNQTRLAKCNYKSPVFNTKATDKQKIYLKDLMIKRNFSNKSGKPINYAETLPHTENINKLGINKWLKILTVFEADDLISTLI